MLKRKEVRKHANAMEKKLRESDHKIHWRILSLTYLVEQLKEKIKKMEDNLIIPYMAEETMNKFESQSSISMEIIEKVENECVNASNIAMMIADKVKSLKW